MCLMIATEMLKEQRLRKLPVNIKTMVDVLVLPSIQSELPDIRDLAFCCLGLACLHDVSLARNHLLLFLQVSQVDHESVQATAVKVVFDLLLLYGFEAFSLTCPGSSSKTKTPDTLDQAHETLVADGEGKEVEGGENSEEGEEGAGEEGETKKITQRILATMADFLDGISGEGLAKLLLSRRVISQKLLARLLVLSCREMVGEVFVPVLEAISEAPAESLRHVDLDQLADYLIHLCAPQEPNGDSVHDSLAISVANAVLSEPENSVLTRVYCRSLTHMQLSSSNKAELLILTEQIERNVGDKRSPKTSLGL
ncbi:Condensin complex subunit 3 [Geodia barretti]|uniref:Condensin complex subunit 3 n=1 Tax=Geodia barretti TaxID=519541 RepID=A0AA35X1W4_GEOBA|nr:Condensin complex subunit 3 [Geodia barretti]